MLMHDGGEEGAAAGHLHPAISVIEVHSPRLSLNRSHIALLILGIPYERRRMIGREQGAGREESVPITRAPSVLIRYKSLHIVGYTTYAGFDTCISPRTFNPHCNRLPRQLSQIFLNGFLLILRRPPPTYHPDLPPRALSPSPPRAIWRVHFCSGSESM